jgi:hypothetical protein
MKRKIREDEESTISATNLNNQNTTSDSTQMISSTNTDENNKDEDKDPMIDYILQQLKQHNSKQQQQNQLEYTAKQQQADKIIKDIEEYIKNNSQK